jgi:hypothetical protein
MGASTSQQLIAKGKGENGYNNSGISNDSQWVDFFNDALADLVDDLGIEESLDPIVFVSTVRENTLPADYFSLVNLYDGNGCEVYERRSYNQKYPAGYRVLFKGSSYVIDLYSFTTNQTFTGQYYRYAEALTIADYADQHPEVPTVGEKALIYYAISKALRNNNQPVGDYLKLYERERMKIRDAIAKARGGG